MADSMTANSSSSDLAQFFEPRAFTTARPSASFRLSSATVLLPLVTAIRILATAISCGVISAFLRAISTILVFLRTEIGAGLPARFHWRAVNRAERRVCLASGGRGLRSGRGGADRLQALDHSA